MGGRDRERGIDSVGLSVERFLKHIGIGGVYIKHIRMGVASR